jgi:ubiquinone/menaquinone biosynthesis C-methylase UbiE
MRMNGSVRFEYQESDVHQRYDRGRALGADATRALMASLLAHAPQPIHLVVDLGCGTGRFTTALHETFHARVLGVEPAANMRAMAQAKPHRAAVSFVAGSAEHIPLERGAADLVFLSQVLHHVENLPAAFGEIRRVLRARGRLCIRQTTRENLDSYFYQRFFPLARAIDERRLPWRAALRSLARAGRFREVAVETLRQEIAATGRDYVERIALRTYSDLACIADEAFRAGLEAFRAYSATHPDYPKSAENDLFVFAPN